MTTSSEEILLQVGQVRHKKGDGTLYVMSERLAWMLDHRDTVTVSHRYMDIKMQKISPEGKPKIQLQVVLHDNTTSTFQFVNRQGPAAAIKERDQVKDLLVQLLPKFKRKVNKELEEKNRLLSENPGLLQLYRDLVITQVISPEEFWAQHASQYTQKQNNQKQEVGVSGAFLADIKPQTDGCNGLKYNLTADIIDCIFKTYPAVRKKHIEYVPHKMTEADFWTKFFQSHYFHRDRITTSSKDLFTECAKLDDQEMKKVMSNGVSDPLLDITSFDDKIGDEPLERPAATQNIVHQNMIKRFNQHSIMVLKACQQPAAAKPEVNGTSQLPQMNGEVPSTSADPHEVQAKKMRIREKISYVDLDASCSNTPSVSHLNLTKVERYLHGPTPSASDDSEVWGGDEAVLSCWGRLQQEAGGWGATSRPSAPLVPPAAAVSALGELTPGGALMKCYHDESLAQLVPAPLEKELRNLYLSGCELLRHFWLCFPPTTPQLQEKVEKMHDALHRFHSAKLKPFEDRVLVEFSPLSQQLTSHMNQLLTAAYSKYEMWQSRRKNVSMR
ncbi:general transcription factor IIH subunit 1-like [Macrosteles quadrilineatus]|uniref:general transcription factor IIH subunit 1-like n=1 Tax=Macrosteles quadrilineatus TaxID=74068 RepID=UPI0023E0B913|nr:general transcription factor IIH subunit 1-like [Macrosteles quadrilineatus]